jgi:hypothetical protein
MISRLQDTKSFSGGFECATQSIATETTRIF